LIILSSQVPKKDKLTTTKTTYGKLLKTVCFSVLLFLIFITHPVISQNYPLYFEHLTRDDGLSSNRVNHITEDSLGFIWFGTEEGLNKYDGYSFESVNDFLVDMNSLQDLAINFILEDLTKPNLWLATRNGLIYFNRYQNKFEKLPGTDLDNTTASSNITSLCFDKAGNLWIATINGLYMRDHKTQRIKALIKSGKGKYSKILTVYHDQKNRMWIGSNSGIFLFNEKSQTFKKYFDLPDMKMVTIITEDRKGNFWIGTDQSGLFIGTDKNGGTLLKRLSKKNGKLASNRIYGIIKNTPDSYFVLVRDGGLYEYNYEDDHLKYYPYDIHNPDGINSTALITGFKSSNNIIWIGTYNSGVNYLDKSQKRFILYHVNFKEDGLFNNNIRALAEDSEGYVWIGTKEGGGLSRFDKSKGTFRNYIKSDRPGGLLDDYIFSICELDKNELLIGTFREGLARFNKKTEKFVYYTHQKDNYNSLSDNRVYVIFKDKKGTVWVGNYFDLQTFDPKTGLFKTLEGIFRPRCFWQHQNQLWIGTRGDGIYALDDQYRILHHFTYNPADSTGLSSDDIYTIRGSGDTLWFGTRHGLNRLILSKNQLHTFTVNDGLPSNWIRGMEIDNQGNIWVSTSKGLSKLDMNTGKFHNYDVRDRLQGNEFERYVSLKTHDGYLLFGGHNGFNIFKPEDITDNTSIPPVYITDISLFNKSLKPGINGSPLKNDILFTDNLILNYDQSAITFHYVALNYTSPEKNHYKYILEGFEEKWNDAGTNTFAVYTNIPPGKYTFKVTGSNNDNYWNTKGASLNITVTPPFWKTGWAYFFYFLLIASIIYTVRRIVIFRIEQNKLLEYERLDKERLKEMNQSKLRFFTNISHEFRTPLTLISGPLEKLQKEKTLDGPHQYLLELVINNVKRLLLLMNELMDFRKAEHGLLKLHISKHDLIENIKESLSCFEEKAKEKQLKITHNFNIPENGEFWYDKNILDKILFNLLSNAIKYTPENGIIKIKLTVNDDGNAFISVANNGKGIPEDKLENIFERFYQLDGDNNLYEGTGIGLTFSKRLIEAHKGTISVESTPDEWTTFTIKFPVRKGLFDEKELSENANQFETASMIKEPVSTEFKTGKTKTKNGRKLLIVEDNDELRDYLKFIFKDFEVLEASNGEKGVKLAKQHLPDIIISDIMMPIMDGLEMCEKIKTDFSTSHIPVVLLTAKTDIQHKIKGVETGADAYIEKPFNTEYLTAVVNNLLEQRERVRKKFSEEPEMEMKDATVCASDRRFIEKAHKVIKENINNPELSVDKLSTELGLSRSQLFRKFNVLFNQKPNELIRKEKLKYAKKLLMTGDYNVNEVAEMAGFKSASYFITSFKKHFGKTPSSFLK
jgi:signal transduction histidine kinase/ligand-binding sensor domain-containing protein/DNA-binding response OmpR family regulator